MKRPLILCKWALLILLKLSKEPKRPSQLLKEIPEINEKLLFERLKALTNLGLIRKHSNNSYPLEVYYKLENNEFIKNLLFFLKELPLSIEEFISIISKKWVFEILETLNSEISPKEILQKIHNLSEKILYQRLREFQNINLVERIIYNTKPVKIKYKLTEYGIRALPILKRAHEIILSN